MSKKESGFTLIEIVMVLVLLGILSAVAVPKYFDLQDKALQNAAKGTVAEVQARLNAKFADELLSGKACAAAKTAALTEAKNQDYGDWTFTLADDGAITALKYAKNDTEITAPTGGWKVAVPTCN